MIEFDLIMAAVNALSSSMKESSEMIKKGDLPAIREEEAKQEIAMRMAAHQAKVAQELAIADRIRNAGEVEIEEFYDTEGEGSVGLKGDEGGVTLGVSGSGRHVVRRVYRFRALSSRPAPKEVGGGSDSKA